jgi:tRNA (cytidine56-2'-O)-methyltransferase
MTVTVLRLGHRASRDKRITTHVGLVARAFRADNIFYSGQKDSSLERSLHSVTDQWGGPFGVAHVRDWKALVRDWNGKSVHLTMYGIPFQRRMGRVRRAGNLLVIVGGEKVPPEAYRLSDFNLAVGSQPHSEVAALSVFLHEYFRGKELETEFRGAKKKVIPQERGKKVIK